MSMMGTLAKVAIGIAVAKGASAMMKGGSGSGAGGGLGGLLGGGAGAQPQAQAGGAGLEGMMGSLLGGGGQQGGGLGGLLEGLQGGGGQQGGGLDQLLGGLQGGGAGGSGGGLGGLLQGLGGGQGGSGGGLGGLLGGLAAAAGGGAAAASSSGGAFGDVLNQAFAQGGEPEVQPTPEQDVAAGLMLKAMIQAAKSDGQIDQAEQSKLLDHLGDVSDEERMFVSREMEAPMDVQGLAQAVPNGLEPQVYAMSVLAIDLDNNAEAQYLHDLASAMGLQPASVNQIHDQLGVPKIYQ
ncbi:MAG: DUF533 domain-containing protein [Pseudomonadota bacterium]